MSERTRILLIEDNPAEVFLLRKCLSRVPFPHDLDVAEDGVEALAFLRREGAFVDRRRPDLILLDLNLPGKDGRQVLAEVKADTSLRRIPVVVLTSSDDAEDVRTAYDRQASAYLVKPPNLVGFQQIVAGIGRFWFSMVKYSSKD